MENLDPLRQKPDFEKQLIEELNKLPYTAHLDDGQFNDGQGAGFELGAKWAKGFFESRIRELEEALDAKDKEMEGLIEIHHANDAELESDRDKFAIGFAEWIAKKSIDNTLPWTETTAELLELYKESLLNQKP